MNSLSAVGLSNWNYLFTIQHLQLVLKGNLTLYFYLSKLLYLIESKPIEKGLKAN